ncbi:hypothetical protein K0817_005420 [Microbacterium sp. HD4P20]|uniref:alpha-L-rhamnosidase-related protein n=1 Tax=Microbacterium sp. HD4P20 TaxID=2864874 RepID=UPI001C63E1EE|nr:amylo-alpha-1,6-glucosidase [Microbacterium sp. HD4P20]MCP2636007.1 hypothetical protein [Microbacterium sp. HD4P20]
MTTRRDASAMPWIGQWIGADMPTDAGMHRIGFRRDVQIGEPPAALRIRLSADSRYVLWVNGQELGRGPVRGQQYRWTYDDYDIAPALVPGLNTIAVLVTFYGDDNAMWQRARVADGLGSAACLIIDAPEPWVDLCTGPQWLARAMTEWSTIPGGGTLAALPVEIVDLRTHDHDWLRSSGSLEDFTPARIAEATHPGSRRSRPPVYPYGPLLPRRIAALGGETVTAARSVVCSAPEQPHGPPIDTVLTALASIEDAWHAHAEQPLERGDLRASAAEPLLWQFDFGRVVSGFVDIEFDAPAGTVLDLAYLERPFQHGRNERYLPRAGARVTASGGRSRFRALETNGMRIAAILITPPTEGLVGISALRVHEHLYPFTGGAAFASSDADLERLWHAGVRTVRLNSSDAFTDCPTREQRAWVGDAVIHLGVHLVANEDWRLAARHLEICDSPRSDGLLPMSVAGDIESASRHSIPDWSLHWLHGLWMYARASKDWDFVRAHLPTAERVLTWFEQYADVEGILTNVPEWALVDWSSVFTSGRSSILTALWARGLREFAELSDAVGNVGNAQRARSRVELIELSFECFWDADRGVYVDHVVERMRMPATSQAANAAAIVAGLVPPDRRAALVSRITDDALLVTRGWNTASPTVTIGEKVQDRTLGVQRIDWDVHREIVRAEPFFSSVVHDAIAQAGRADLLPALLRRWLRFLTEGYDTFGECWEWGTPAHGWSATPTRDLTVHVLGVEPAGFDTEAYRVAPAKTGISWIRAAVPTPRGLLRVEVNGSQLRLSGPIPTQVHAWNGQVQTYPAGEHHIDLTTGELTRHDKHATHPINGVKG